MYGIGNVVSSQNEVEKSPVTELGLGANSYGVGLNGPNCSGGQEGGKLVYALLCYGDAMRVFNLDGRSCL